MIVSYHNVNALETGAVSSNDPLVSPNTRHVIIHSFGPNQKGDPLHLKKFDNEPLQLRRACADALFTMRVYLVFIIPLIGLPSRVHASGCRVGTKCVYNRGIIIVLRNIAR